MVDIEDQSTFSGSQAVLQAPPEMPQPPQPTMRRNLIIAVSAGALIILLLVAALLSPAKKTKVQEVTSSPSPTSAPQLSQMKQQIMQNDQVIQQANPEENITLPPEVDMEVDF